MAAEILQILGTQVRNRRKALGLTQEQLAELADLSVDMVGRVERGQSGLLLEKLATVADVLNSPPGALLGFEVESRSLPVERHNAFNAIAVQLINLDVDQLEWMSKLIRVALER